MKTWNAQAPSTSAPVIALGVSPWKIRAALALTVASIMVVGYGIGVWMDRWGAPPDLTSAAESLKRVPYEIGDWVGEDLEGSEEQNRGAEVVASLTRRYVNRRTGASATIALVCGRAVPVTRHTPDYCYPAAGFEPLDPPWKTDVELGGKSAKASFFHCDYVKPNIAVPTGLSILWCHGDGSHWTASENARYLHIAKRVLYKLYVIRETSGLATAPKDIDHDGFVKDFMPALSQSLFGEPGSQS